jgi:hypothetical protein
MSENMDLPVGKTCGDCVHFDRCVGLIGVKADYTMCDFYPIRFREKSESKAAGK